jgi:DNA-binding MarR family transcriptional regulator
LDQGGFVPDTNHSDIEQSVVEQSRVGATFIRVARKHGDGDMASLDAVIGLLDAADRIRGEFTELYAKHDLARGRFRILITLYDKTPSEGVAPTELAEYCGISRATVTGIVDTLEEQGTVERIASTDDRRSIRVRLTDAGRAKIDAILPEMIDVSRRAWAGLAHDERLAQLWNKR